MTATSDDWNGAKPDHAFFHEVIRAAPCDAGQTVYVGDRLDNDLRPARRRAFGRRSFAEGRGPTSRTESDLPGAADWCITTLAESLPLVAEANAIIALTSASRPGVLLWGHRAGLWLRLFLDGAPGDLAAIAKGRKRRKGWQNGSAILRVVRQPLIWSLLINGLARPGHSQRAES